MPLSRREFVLTGIHATASAAIPASAQGPDTPSRPRDLASLTLAEAADLIRRRDVSPVELTQACLDRIGRHDKLINAYITVMRDPALAAARQAESEIRRGRRRGPLHGIPIALKDNIDTAGVLTTAASGVFRDRVPTEDAEVVTRLTRAGAVLLGKLNLHEFALGGTSSVTYYGAVRNPWATDRVPGGSSGGSAAAVAADMCFAALGTDTYGSIRIPGSQCGIVGLKPTYGRVSNRGVIPMAWTLDHVGPMCKSVRDAALVLAAIAGYDSLDPASLDAPLSDYARAIGTSARKLRVGIARKPFFDNLDPEVAGAVETAIGVLRRLTAGVIEVETPATGNVADIGNPEIYAYHLPWLTKSADAYQPPTRTLIQGAGNVTAAAYVQARRQVDLLRREIRRVFATVDVVVTPTQRGVAQPIAPGPPPEGGGRGAAPAGAGGLVNTAAFNIYGLPTITVPCGFSAAGLPIGLQISANHFAESTVLALAHAYERATAWHARRPPL